jgi:Fe-Mn family superoxide dismutase
MRVINLRDYYPVNESKSNLFKRKPLDYSFSSLEPYIDRETMEEHYNVHYKKYTDLLNECVKEESIPVFMGPNMEGIKEILKDVGRYSDKLRNNSGGFYNHFLYFDQFTPQKNSPSGEIKKSILYSFVSLSNLKNEMIEQGLSQFGSGWVWLLSDYSNNLYIMTTPNQDNPLMDESFNGKILLGIDVWEHAYYLKHKADRKSYLKDVFNLIDWDKVNQRLESFE